MNNDRSYLPFHEKHHLRLDANNVPEVFRHLIPLAERWGIHYVEDLDDFEIRRILLSEASEEDIDNLMEVMAPYMDASVEHDKYLYDWLADPEAYSANVSTEYLAFTYLGMIYDVVFSDRRKPSKS